jgi:two-component system sensor kinase FixL
MISLPTRFGRKATLAQVALLILSIALIDWKVNADVPLGFLYLLPMALAGSVLRRWQITLLSSVCMVLAEEFNGYAWSPQSGISRDILYFAAFCGVGLFVHEMVASRQASWMHIQSIEREMQARQDAEEQLKILIESSPIAILTADAEGVILLANDAAHRLFNLPPHALPGRRIHSYLPSLINVPAMRGNQHLFRTVMQCTGRREDGDVFIADIWFSTYATTSGARLAAIVIDSSEELRDREEAGLHQLLVASRILVGAVSHEVRNVCGAIAVVHENLARCEHLAHNQDFDALGTLVHALENIASMELRQTSNQPVSMNIGSFLEELKVILGPELREKQIDTHWEMEPDLPTVWADRQSLMQVFLNLIKNSERALESQEQRSLSITAHTEAQRVLIHVTDSGRGVGNPELLFRPFQEKARATGLGLYLSRALMRSFHGNLWHHPSSSGATFVVELSRVQV